MNLNRANFNNMFDVISISTESLSDSDLSDEDDILEDSSNNSVDNSDDEAAGGGDVPHDADDDDDDDPNWETEEEVEADA